MATLFGARASELRQSKRSDHNGDIRSIWLLHVHAQRRRWSSRSCLRCCNCECANRFAKPHSDANSFSDAITNTESEYHTEADGNSFGNAIANTEA